MSNDSNGLLDTSLITVFTGVLALDCPRLNVILSTILSFHSSIISGTLSLINVLFSKFIFNNCCASTSLDTSLITAFIGILALDCPGLNVVLST